MSSKINTADGLLTAALKLAREKKYEQALKAIETLDAEGLESNSLRKVALVNSYCGLLAASELCWLEIDRRKEMSAGDFYMLASLQADLLKRELAEHNFEREIALAAETGNSYYLSSSVIRLAQLLVENKKHQRAREVLSLIDNEAGDFLPHVGYRTKVDILRDMGDLAKG
jgi:hypothetical protein